MMQYWAQIRASDCYFLENNDRHLLSTYYGPGLCYILWFQYNNNLCHLPLYKNKIDL